MILINAPTVVGNPQERNLTELAIEMIDQFRGDGGMMLVGRQVYEYLQENSPEVFDYAQSKDIQIAPVPC